jgi:dipeptide/tripeptide permease
MMHKSIDTTNVYSIILNGIILFYVMRLENIKECDCVNDWRKDYIKYYAIAVMCVSLLCIIICQNSAKKQQNHLQMVVGVLRMVAGVVAFYCLFTYIRDLRDSCQCAMDNTENKRINEFLTTYTVLICVVLLFAVSFMLSMGINMVKK